MLIPQPHNVLPAALTHGRTRTGRPAACQLHGHLPPSPQHRTSMYQNAAPPALPHVNPTHYLANALHPQAPPQTPRFSSTHFPLGPHPQARAGTSVSVTPRCLTRCVLFHACPYPNRRHPAAAVRSACSTADSYPRPSRRSAAHKSPSPFPSLPALYPYDPAPHLHHTTPVTPPTPAPNAPHPRRHPAAAVCRGGPAALPPAVGAVGAAALQGGAGPRRQQRGAAGRHAPAQ